jgi:hypothetical protein
MLFKSLRHSGDWAAEEARPPTILSYARSGWRALLYVPAVGAIGIAFSSWRGWPAATGIFVGMIIATVARDLGWCRRIVQSWPLTREITNWNRVDELLARSDGPAA